MKQYLGDGVYVDFDGYALVLTAENGSEVTDTIVLEPDVFLSLVQYVKTINEGRRQNGHNIEEREIQTAIDAYNKRQSDDQARSRDRAPRTCARCYGPGAAN